MLRVTSAGRTVSGAGSAARGGSREAGAQASTRRCRQSRRSSPELQPGQQVISTFDKPVKPTGHIAILQGNLAPEFAVGKITGKEGTKFVGPARCFDQEEDMMAAVAADPQSLKGSVIVIRCEARG